jgi:zinc protease
MQARVERISERVFLVRDKPGTTTGFWMIVHAGFGQEEDGKNLGISHYLEHLVLEGRTEDERLATRFFAGGTSLGRTWPQSTTYEHTAPARPEGPRADLEKLFRFYAASLEGFSVSEADAVRELKVVLQEFDLKVASNPFSSFETQLNRNVLPDHPGNWWWRETREDIQRNTVEAARDFHRAWYARNNAYFVVRGDIEPATLRHIAETALAGTQARDMPARVSLREPRAGVEQIDIRRSDPAIKRAKIYLKKLVRIEDTDVEATRAAVQIAEDFLASRLPGSPFDEIFDKRDLAPGARNLTFHRIAPNSYMLDINADVAPDVSPDQLLGAYSDYVEGLTASSISARSVERLKSRIATERVETERAPRTLFSDLNDWLANGHSYEDYVRWPQRIAAVTPEAVANVLSALARPGRTVTGILAPSRKEARR